MSDEIHSLPEFSASQMISNSALLATYHSSEKMDSFATWLLVGFGAICAIMIGNLGELLKYVSLGSVQLFFAFFALATVFAIIQKYISVVVSGALKASESVERKIEKMPQATLDNFSWAEFRAEILRASFSPAKRLIRPVFDKMESGDLTFASRRMCKLMQIQSFLIAIQAMFHIVSIVCFVRGMAA